MDFAVGSPFPQNISGGYIGTPAYLTFDVFTALATGDKPIDQIGYAVDRYGNALLSVRVDTRTLENPDAEMYYWINKLTGDNPVALAQINGARPHFIRIGVV